MQVVHRHADGYTNLYGEPLTACGKSGMDSRGTFQNADGTWQVARVQLGKPLLRTSTTRLVTCKLCLKTLHPLA